MRCLDCGADNDVPNGRTILAEEILEGDVDVDSGAQEHVQLECTDCGAVLGYLGAAAAIGSSNIRGYY